MGGKLFLHIGRNKAGSTTLQSEWLRHSTTLRANGVQYALFGQQPPPGHDLPSFTSHLALIRYFQDNPSSSLLVSNEGLCCFKEEFAAAMAADLSELDITLLFYTRPYRDWAVSNYLFNILIGQQISDFDDYLASLGERLSFWPALKTWGDAIGWKRVRVRSLHPDDLVDGDLAVDGMAAIGYTQYAGGNVPRANTSPAWISAELIRFLLASRHDNRNPIARNNISDILWLGETIDFQVRAISVELGINLNRGIYLTADQSERLITSYNDDLKRTTSRTGYSLKLDERSHHQTRDFLPSIDSIPSNLIHLLNNNLIKAGLMERITTMVDEEKLDALTHFSL